MLKVYKLKEKFQEFRKGAKFYEYTGCTYGVMGSNEIAVSVVPYKTPALGIPADLLYQSGELINKPFVCPRCTYTTMDSKDFLTHLGESEEIHHPGEAYRILVELVRAGKVKVEVT